MRQRGSLERKDKGEGFFTVLRSAVMSHSSRAYRTALSRIAMITLVLAASFLAFDAMSCFSVAETQEPVVDSQATLTWRLATSFYPETGGSTTQSEGPSHVAYSPDGSQLAVGTVDGVSVYSVQGLVETLTIRLDAGVTSIAYSPSGGLIALGTPTGSIQLRDALDGELARAFVSPLDAVNGLAFSLDGTTLASAGSDGSVRLWRVSDGLLIRVMTVDNAGPMSDVAFSSDGTLLAAGGLDGSARIWRIGDGSMLSSLIGVAGGTSAVALSPDGGTVSVGSAEGVVWLWDFDTADRVRSLPGHDGSITDLAFWSDGTRLAFSSLDGSITIAGVDDGVELETLQSAAGGIASMAVSPAGSTIASGSSDGTVSLWEAYDSQATRYDDASFVADVTIPDYTEIAAGAEFEKIWRLLNTGASTWTGNYALQFVEGDAIGTPIPQAIPETLPGQTADIIVSLQVPTTPGTYRSVWQLINAHGQSFGPLITVVIQVGPTATVTPVPYRLELTASAMWIP